MNHYRERAEDGFWIFLRLLALPFFIAFLIVAFPFYLVGRAVTKLFDLD